MTERVPEVGDTLVRDEKTWAVAAGGGIGGRPPSDRHGASPRGGEGVLAPEELRAMAAMGLAASLLTRSATSRIPQAEAQGSSASRARVACARRARVVDASREQPRNARAIVRVCECSAASSSVSLLCRCSRSPSVSCRDVRECGRRRVGRLHLRGDGRSAHVWRDRVPLTTKSRGFRRVRRYHRSTRCHLGWRAHCALHCHRVRRLIGLPLTDSSCEHEWRVRDGLV